MDTLDKLCTDSWKYIILLTTLDLLPYLLYQGPQNGPAWGLILPL